MHTNRPTQPNSGVDLSSLYTDLCEVSPSTGLAFMTLLTVSLTVEDEKNYLAMNIKIKNNF